MGPLAELAYWRNLMAKMCYIIQQTQEWQLVNMIQVLMQAKSRVLRVIIRKYILQALLIQIIKLF